MVYLDARQRRKLFALAKQAYVNSLLHEQLTEPRKIDFGLLENSEAEINSYNAKAEKRATSTSLYVLLFIVLASIFGLIFFSSNEVVSFVLAAPAICFFAYFLLYSFFSRVFSRHPKTSNLEEYKAKVAKYERWLEVQKEGFWTELSGRQFEVEFGKLLRPFFDRVEVTKGSGDGGVDIIIQDGNSKIIVQCKNHRKQIGPEPVRALVGVMRFFEADTAVVVSLGGFTKAAKEFATSSSSLFLYDLKDIVSLTEQVNSGRIEFAGSFRSAHIESD